MLRNNSTITNKQSFAFIATILFGLFFRLWELTARGFWFDEAVEFWTAIVPLNDIIKMTAGSFQPPLYPFLLHVWMLASTSELWMRLLSVGLNLSALIALMLVIKDLFGIRAAVLTGVVLSLSASLIKYSQEVGEYSLLLALLCWGLFAGFKALNSEKRSSWAAAGVLFGLSILAHYGASITIAALIAWVIGFYIYTKKTDHLKKLLLPVLLIILPGLLVLPLFMQQFTRQGHGSLTIQGGWLEFARKLFEGVFQQLSFLQSGYPFNPMNPALLMALTVFVILLVIIAAWKGSPLHRAVIWLFVLNHMLYFFLVYLGLYAQGTFGFRYSLILLPAAALVLGALFNWLLESTPGVLRKVIALILFISLVLIGMYSLPNRTVSAQIRGNLAWPETDTTREAYYLWKDLHSQDSSLYVYYGAVPGFEYYYSKDNHRSVRDYPTDWMSECWFGKAPPECESDQIIRGNGLRSASDEIWIRELQRIVGSQPNEVWFIYSHGYADEDKQLTILFEKAGYTAQDMGSGLIKFTR